MSQFADVGCRRLRNWCPTLALVHLHFVFYEWMDMMSLLVIFLSDDCPLYDNSCLFFPIWFAWGFDLTCWFCGAEYLAQYDEKSTFDNSMEGYLKDVNAVLELYKASQVKIFAEEKVLDKLKSWTSHFLREELSTYMTNDHRNVFKEVHSWSLLLKLVFLNMLLL